MRLQELIVRPVDASEETRFRDSWSHIALLVPFRRSATPAGHTACFEREWTACLSFSAAALKCAVRDDWIGWTFRHPFDRLNLIAHNSRFLSLPPIVITRTLLPAYARSVKDGFSGTGKIDLARHFYF